MGCSSEAQPPTPSAGQPVTEEKDANTQSEVETLENEKKEESASAQQTPGAREKGEKKQKEKKEQQEEPIREQEKEELKEIKNRSVIYNGSRKTKKIALTFDDGPDKQYTGQILDILKREKVSATFFVIGRMARKHPDMLKRIVQEGHVLANHSWSHRYFPKLPMNQVEREIEKTNRVVKKVTGKEMTLIRPPYGAADGVRKKIHDKGFMIVNWDVDTRDWRSGRTAEAVVKSVKKHAAPGSIILLHSAGGSRDHTVQALPEVIAYLKKQGYSLVTVDDLLDSPAYLETSDQPVSTKKP
ncbi:polysaccharide deacetylase family protein [Paludifilum halophilum]|nr:polysaccharide deacetylase family protein [Paludifilum halophilum]